ncbi:MAG TPA: citrate/2-methylcitrate synthase [Candidatus Saccharimonadales bacterium]|nr:citrate/2-methylcitrate synthase [Candidatus Saccharimonadales bacterium]
MKSKLGLEDVVITSSSICHLNEKSNTVEVRGYDLLDLAEHSSFEETCYLLWHARLPSSNELIEFSQTMSNQRQMPVGMLELMSRLPKTSGMDSLRTMVSALAAYDPEPDNTSIEAVQRRAIKITASMPTIAAAAYRSSQGQEVIPPDPNLTHAQNFLYMLFGKRISSSLSRAFEKSLILYSEHELNASTFSARVTASTLSDIYSSITSAIGTLKGPLHGGANEEAMNLLLAIQSIDNAEPHIRMLLEQKKRIMGFGHRIYKFGDPRAKLMKKISKQVGEETGQVKWHQICEKVEEFLASEKKLYPNLDFYSAPAYYCIGIPIDLYTPIFASSRVSGWSAHIIEQLQHNRIIRPRAEYVGLSGLKYVALSERQ